MRNKTTRRLMVVTSAVFGALVISQSDAAAQTATANLPVQATVVANCNIDVPGTLNFGSYDPAVANAAADLDADTTIDVRCTKNSPNVWIGLDEGSNDNLGQRRMTDGSEFLNYDLYQDGGRTTVWGNLIGDGFSYAPATSSWTSLDVYGRVPQAQDVGVGTYNDTVLATINF
jgi:spore coat protein U-like protein